jgi:hypothetical protein
MSLWWSTPTGVFPCASTRTSWWSSPPREQPSKEEEGFGKGGAWRAQYEERARRMKEIEGSKLRSLTNSELQARIDLLHHHIVDEEKHSSGSRHHIKLWQDYEEAVNVKYIRNMETSFAACMETIERL